MNKPLGTHAVLQPLTATLVHPLRYAWPPGIIRQQHTHMGLYIVLCVLEERVLQQA